jgi:hypothetical protein
MNLNYDNRFSHYHNNIHLPCPPYGNTLIRYHKLSAIPLLNISHNRIIKHWDYYWSLILKSTIKLINDYEQPNLFGISPFEIHFNKSGDWIKDDVMFELLFTPKDPEKANGPFYVTAFKKFKVIHSQASF